MKYRVFCTQANGRRTHALRFQARGRRSRDVWTATTTLLTSVLRGRRSVRAARAIRARDRTRHHQDLVLPFLQQLTTFRVQGPTLAASARSAHALRRALPRQALGRLRPRSSAGPAAIRGVRWRQTSTRIVIGSGFGGAVTACRLADGGRQGARARARPPLDAENVSRARPTDPWVWDDGNPVARQRLVRLPDLSAHDRRAGRRRRRRLARLRQHLDRGQARHVRRQAGRRRSPTTELKPHYDTRRTDARTSRRCPTNQWPERTQAVKRGAPNRPATANRFEPLELAVTFDEHWTYDSRRPHDAAALEDVHQRARREQGTCVHLGNCDIGCDVNARNTLDLNYLAVAEKQGADVRPLHLVRDIEPVARRLPGRPSNGSSTARSKPGTRHRARCVDRRRRLARIDRAAAPLPRRHRQRCRT